MKVETTVDMLYETPEKETTPAIGQVYGDQSSTSATAVSSRVLVRIPFSKWSSE